MAHSWRGMFLVFLFRFHNTRRFVHIFEHPHLIKGIFWKSIRTSTMFLRKGTTSQGGSQLRQTPMRPRNYHNFATRLARLHFLKYMSGKLHVLSFFEIGINRNAQFESNRCECFDLTMIEMTTSIGRKGIEKGGIWPCLIKQAEKPYSELVPIPRDCSVDCVYHSLQEDHTFHNAALTKWSFRIPVQW